MIEDFKIGDRVKHSQEWVLSYPFSTRKHIEKIGTVVGFSINNECCIVRWEGNENASSIHWHFLEIAPQTNRKPKYAMKGKIKYDTTALLDHPIFKAGVAGALHDLYYSNVLDRNIDVGEISAAYGAAFAECPSFRQIIQETASKYSKECEEIPSLPIDSKPSVDLVFQVTVNDIK